MKINLTNSRPALLIIDLQELFTSAVGPFHNITSTGLINKVNTFMADCHKLNLPVIFSRYLLRDDLSDAGLLADNPVVRDGHFCASSAWMKLDHRLQQIESGIYLQRNRPGAFWGGELELTLAQNNIDTLILCGLSVNNAISTTAREAFARDIPVMVVKECSGAAPWETDLNIYFDILNNWTAEVASMRDIKKRLNEAVNLQKELKK